MRYPAYAVGIHGLRLTLGRAPNFNASGPERSIGSQIMAVSGPLARTIADVRLAFEAMAAPQAPDARDPWFVPVPLEGPKVAKRAALCIAPDGLEVASEVKAALIDAAKRLERAGWTVEEIANTPPLKEAAQLQVNLWIGDSYAAQLEAAEREGDEGALACLRGHADVGRSLDFATFSKTLIRRATLTRMWQMFFDKYPVLLMPVSGELPFEDQLDIRDAKILGSRVACAGADDRHAVHGFAGIDGVDRSCRANAGRRAGGRGALSRGFCLLAGEAIEVGGTPPSPIDPVGYT